MTTTPSQSFESKEFPFSRSDFGRIAAILQMDAGIVLAEVKAPLVYSRLVKRLRTLGLENFRDYCALVDRREGSEERGHMVAALTTTITRFFREPHHFEHLKTNVLPELVDTIRRGGRLRIWSAGCSSGEEPYSIAMTVLSVMPDAFRHDVRILATDINKVVLERAERGIYGEVALSPLSRAQRGDWFEPVRAAENDNLWRVGDELRSLVGFRELNLLAPWPMRQAYQAIFCRNVAIYFEERLQTELWDRFESLLAPHGRLYLGHSERISGTANKLVLDGCTTYRLRSEEPS